MSNCSREPLTRRRKAAVIAASSACLAASVPILLRHSGGSGSADVADGAIGLVVGLLLGGALVMLILAVRRSRSTS